MTTFHDFSADTIVGSQDVFDRFAGQVVLVVNTASKCGFTPQYKGLQSLQDQFGGQDFTVLGFPCDQFMHQEPADDGEIAEFCERNFGVSFPLFSKIEVNGKGTHPLFKWLKGQKKGALGGRINWNFTKFLVGKDGQVIGRYSPKTEPATITGDIEKALGN